MVAILNTVKDIDRLRQISTVLMKHGFGEIVGRMGLGGGAKPDGEGNVQPRLTLAERLRLALQELGPSFVKLGQIASTRPDLIPADVIVELKKLQDSVAPIPLEDVHATIVEALGAPVAETYTWFDDQPLASASIGQVHRARLKDPDLGGREVEVVVKVQRPRIHATIERDLDLLYLLARLIERAIPESRIYSPSGLVAEFDRAITAELDFTVEADNAERFAKNFDGSVRVHFPRVYRQASGKKALTLEFLDGKKIYAAVADGVSGEAIAKSSLHIIAQMIFEDGFFHADPHPGNVLIIGAKEQPIVGLLDLGLVGRLSADLRDKVIDLMVAAVKNDADSLADALLAIGRPRGRVDLPAFRAEVARLSERYLGKPLAEIELSAMIRDLVQGAIKFDIEMPTELLMVGKALMTVEGVGKEIYPELDVWSELKPYFLKLLWRRYHPERLARDAGRTLLELASAAQNLPRHLAGILRDLERGQLEIKAADPQLPLVADRLGRRVYASVTVGSFTLAGGWLLAAGRHENIGLTLLILAGVQLAVHLAYDVLRKKSVTRP